MDGRHFDERSAIPWLARLGAPLVGVPLLVGLLALGTGGEADGVWGAGQVTATVQSDAQDARVEFAPGTFAGDEEFCG